MIYLILDASSSSTTSPSNEKENKDSSNAQLESSFSKKRKLQESRMAIRHKEKMQRLDKFNELFEKMVEKM